MGFVWFVLGGAIGFAIAWYLQKRKCDLELAERDHMVARLKTDLAAATESKALMERLSAEAAAPEIDAPERDAEQPSNDNSVEDVAEDDPEPVVEEAAGADKLTRINGIGPVIAKKLNGLGITTFAQIAAFTEEDVERVNGQLNFKGRIEREDWIGQAKTLTGGD